MYFLIVFLKHILFNNVGLFSFSSIVNIAYYFPHPQGGLYSTLQVMPKMNKSLNAKMFMKLLSKYWLIAQFK
jgi:hypothetical protein